MTALNVYIGTDESHVFTDGGNYRADTLEFVHMGSKVLPLAGLVGIIAWSGPSPLGFDLMRDVERESPTDIWDYAEIINQKMEEQNHLGQTQQPYSILLVTAGLGLALQEDNRIDQLYAENTVLSISSQLEFDSSNICESGLAIMEDQRSSGVVYGWCQHTLVSKDHIGFEILRRWS